MLESISEKDLISEISRTEGLLDKKLFNFWQLIRIHPEKWIENGFGADSGGFWVVAVSGKRIIWYNDIEEGFNIADYEKYGEIKNYTCDQFDLNHIVWQLYNIGGGTMTRSLAEPLTDI